MVYRPFLSVFAVRLTLPVSDVAVTEAFSICRPSADAEVTRKRAHNFQVFFGELFATGFLSQQHDANQALTYDQGQQQIDFN